MNYNDILKKTIRNPLLLNFKDKKVNEYLQEIIKTTGSLNGIQDCRVFPQLSKSSDSYITDAAQPNNVRGTSPQSLHYKDEELNETLDGFKDGKPNGQGIDYWENGKIQYDGKWKNEEWKEMEISQYVLARSMFYISFSRI